MAKKVIVEAFLPDLASAHAEIVVQGEASNIPAALAQATRALFKDKRVRGRRIHSFKFTVSVLNVEKKEGQ